MSALRLCPGDWRLTEEDMEAIAGLRKELLGYARRRTGNTADAEDAFSETIMAAGRNFEHRSTIRHYLFCILKRQVANLCRRKERGPPWGGAQPSEAEFEDVSVDSPGPHTRLSWLRNAQKIRASLERIPVAYREVVRLAVDGYDNIEIAAQLGLRYNTVRSRLSRGNAYLAEFLLSDGQIGSEDNSVQRKPKTTRRRCESTVVCGGATCTV